MAEIKIGPPPANLTNGEKRRWWIEKIGSVPVDYKRAVIIQEAPAGDGEMPAEPEAEDASIGWAKLTEKAQQYHDGLIAANELLRAIIIEVGDVPAPFWEQRASWLAERLSK